MIGFVLRRRLSRSIACFAAKGWKQGEVSHGLQDKSRKVRPVGWVRDDSNFKLPSNIASNPGNVPFSAMLSEPSSFDTFSRKQ
jgi:hypothetical protein